MAEEEESACKNEPENAKAKKNVITKTKCRVIKTIEEPPKTKRQVKKNSSSSLKDPPTYSEISRAKRISQEQINQLIGYIVDDGMTITAASAKANMGLTAGSSYYRRYMNDPNGNIPIAYSSSKSPKTCTTSQITQLIHYIEHDHLSITKAAEKAAMGVSTGSRYYNKYITDPNRTIPIPREKTAPVSLCTKDQVKRLIHHIKHDNMTLTAASAKVKMSSSTGRKYYHKYLLDPNHRIPCPRNRSSPLPMCTQAQINQLIHHVVYDKMSIPEAAFKTNITEKKARDYYKRYSQDPNHAIPKPLQRLLQSHLQAKVEKLVGYIVNDNMSIRDASLKADMAETTARKHYRIYREMPSR